MSAYSDIMYLSRPAGHHARMCRADRAKIFAPFAALRGYEEAVYQQNIRRVERIVLTEDSKAKIDRRLKKLERGMEVAVTYFRRDPGPDGMGGFAEGMYETITGKVHWLDSIGGNLVLNVGKGPGTEISFGDILSLELLG